MNILSLHGVKKVHISLVENKSTEADSHFGAIDYEMQKISIEMEGGDEFLIDLFSSPGVMMNVTNEAA